MQFNYYLHTTCLFTFICCPPLQMTLKSQQSSNSISQQFQNCAQILDLKQESATLTILKIVTEAFLFNSAKCLLSLPSNLNFHCRLCVLVTRKFHCLFFKIARHEITHILHFLKRSQPFCLCKIFYCFFKLDSDVIFSLENGTLSFCF